MNQLLLFFSMMGMALWLSAQSTFPVAGIADEREGFYAFTNATIVMAPGQQISGATLLIKEGRIRAVGKDVSIPDGAVTIDLEGKYIYPSFIDIFSNYGMPKAKKAKKESHQQPKAQVNSLKKGPFHWNQAIKPEVEAVELFKTSAEDAAAFRKYGFGAVLTHKNDGIARGTGCVVLLGNDKAQEMVIKNRAAAHYSFKKGSSKQQYPGSLMGTIALLRQTYLDARWYIKTAGKVESNVSLEAWIKNQSLPQIFEVGEKWSVIRADKIGDEFGKQYIIKGAGDEYQCLEEIRSTGARMIIPLKYPAPFEVSDPYRAMQVGLKEMKHWESAPSNAAYLEQAGIEFALTMAGLKKKQEFIPNLHKAVERGLSEETALKALTTIPAGMLSMENELGTLEKGKIANFFIASAPVFEKRHIIYENWVNGKRYVVNNMSVKDIRGSYELAFAGNTYPLKATGDVARPKLSIHPDDTTRIPVKFDLKGELINLVFSFDQKPPRKMIRLSGYFEGRNWKGRGQMEDGRWIDWSATFKQEPEEERSRSKKEKSIKPGDILLPFQAYGRKALPTREHVLIRNATVWTNESEDILESADVRINDGKIVAVGKSLAPQGATVIDGTGKHVTSGIIDEHSHIAIKSGVNECTQVVTAEVRIGDVINPENINVYRQLAGGVTAAQLLHGSCNPIGGQSALVKFRWGQSAEGMKIAGADGFIKFALGENVKRSRDNRNKRYPDTRMGVEQVFYDAFTRAKKYQKETANKLSPIPSRKDLELEALVEILEEKRFITCHSYVQSEINMLMHVADSMGFKVNTFTHILEGYKVADKMKAHGVGGSTFSDWWAYKFEVYDAIPYNGALMHNQGVVTAYNSDDAEMGRRLNQEAAKAVKYGGVSEEEAWKFVTLNPAKLLHLDDKMGSIKVGKDADIVIWSENPLSIYAKAEKTFVDGVRYFDQEEDQELRQYIAAERNRLIQAMLAAKKRGSKTQAAKPKPDDSYHCKDANP